MKTGKFLTFKNTNSELSNALYVKPTDKTSCKLDVGAGVWVGICGYDGMFV